MTFFNLFPSTWCYRSILPHSFHTEATSHDPLQVILSPLLDFIQMTMIACAMLRFSSFLCKTGDHITSIDIQHGIKSACSLGIHMSFVMNKLSLPPPPPTYSQTLVSPHIITSVDTSVKTIWRSRGNLKIIRFLLKPL